MSRYGGGGGTGGPAAQPGRAPKSAGRTARRVRLTRRGKIISWSAIVVVAAVVAGSLTAYVNYRKVYDSIRHVTVTGLGKRPPKYTNALNILVFGTDKRAGLSPHMQAVLHVGTNQGENNTDTIMILHISPGRGTVTALSIPRDTMLPAYACAPGRHWTGQQQDLTAQVQVNSLFQIGGPSCLYYTLEQVTGIHIDHFIELDFVGFVKAVNDVGGVNICLPFAVNDFNSGLQLSKGFHHINGTTALKFWRTRYSIGNGDDLQRIQRDQYLLAQVLHGVLHKGLLTNPFRLWSVVKDVAASMTTDSGMTPTDLLHVAASLAHINTSHVQFITTPNTPDPVQPAQVVLAQPQAGQLFQAVAHDRTLPRNAGKPGKGGKGSQPPLVLTVQPAKVKVTVLNGSGQANVAAVAATALTNRGFHVLGKGDAVSFTYTKSVIEYSSASALPAAQTLRKQLSSVTVQHTAGIAPGTVTLILGSTFTALAPQSAGGQGTTPGQPVNSLAKSYGGITGNVSCTGDSAAFQGANSP